MRFRIKQIDDNLFIAQVKIGWFGDWEGIDNKFKENWFNKDFQTEFCAKPTLLEAQDEIVIYKKNTKKR